MTEKPSEEAIRRWNLTAYGLVGLLLAIIIGGFALVFH